MNYTELVAASIAYADRYDLEVSQSMNIFIIMVESRVNRLLKTRKQSARAYTLTQDGTEYYSLPPDWAGMRDIQLTSAIPTGEHSVKSFNLLDPKQFDQKRDQPYGGMLYYTVIADQIQIYPKQDAGKTIEMVYFQKVPNLTTLAPNNWLSDDQPDIYLSGMTAEIELFAKNYDAATGWYDRLKLSVDELDSVDWVERWSGDPLQVRLG